MKSPKKTAQQKETKKALFKIACSGALFQATNKAYGHSNIIHETAAASLSGGILQEGYQCGMVWGASCGAGAEAFRRYGYSDKAIHSAISASRKLVESFTHKAGTLDCREFTGSNFKSKFGLMKYLITGKTFKCSNFIQEWVLEAIETTENALSENENSDSQAQSCATQVAENMGASAEEQITIAGFAGGIGLSGGACGALAAAIWLKSIRWYTENSIEMVLDIPEAKKSLAVFCDATNSEFRCDNICGQRFNSPEEHTEFLKNGGCEKLINLLAQA